MAPRDAGPPHKARVWVPRTAQHQNCMLGTAPSGMREVRTAILARRCAHAIVDATGEVEFWINFQWFLTHASGSVLTAAGVIVAPRREVHGQNSCQKSWVDMTAALPPDTNNLERIADRLTQGRACRLVPHQWNRRAFVRWLLNRFIAGKQRCRCHRRQHPLAPSARKWTSLIRPAPKQRKS